MSSIQKIPAMDSTYNIADVEGLWNALSAENTLCDVHGAFPPFRVWASCFTSPGETRTLFFKDQEKAVLLPLMSRTDVRMKIPLRVLHTPQNYYWRCGYPIVGKDLRPSLDLLLRYMKQLSEWDLLELGPMREDWEGFDALVEAGKRFSMSPRLISYEVPTVRMEGDWASYYEGRGKSFRESTDKRERRVEKRHGELRFVELRDREHLENALAQFFLIEGSGWKGEQGTSIASDPQTMTFFTNLAYVAADRGWLRLYMLYAGDECIASQFAVCYRQVLYLLKFGYNEEWSAYSPGTLLLKHLFRRAFEDPEIDVADFYARMNNGSDYKANWANGVHRYTTIQFFHPGSIRSRLFRCGLTLKQTAQQLKQKQGNVESAEPQKAES